MHIQPASQHPSTSQIHSPSSSTLHIPSLLRPSTPAQLISSMPSRPSSRSSTPGPPPSRLPVEPSQAGGVTHHRPSFVHTSTSLVTPSVTSTTPSTSHTDHGFPPEKEEPPAYPYHGGYEQGPSFRDPFSHNAHSNTYSGHAFAQASRAASRRSSLVPIPEPCFLNKMRDKILGKEGGMGRALVLGWVITTLGFVIATAFWKGELFGGELPSHYRPQRRS
jgi:hypothetical protein